MPKINVLPKEVSELIAAGEVIERPVSVIKELVENSIDAGAKCVTVEIKNGGVTFMRVSDDGCGISPEDVPTAFLRHATSKVSVAEDLDCVFTHGFRGEALASVAAVARVELMTKRAEDALGCSYKIDGEDCELSETGCPDGTTLIIRDLFFNTPARLKFLKKDVTEGNSVQSVVDKLALSHPEVSIRFIRDNKPIFTTSGDGNYRSAIYSVLGKQFAAGLLAVDFTQGGIRVDGYISQPMFSRGNRTMQQFFVNHRCVKSLVLMTALEEGYRNSIMVGKFPACVLNITIAPSDADVNVSPSKTEIRFADDKAVFNTVFMAVKNAILNGDNMKELTIPEKKPAPKPPETIKATPVSVVQTDLSEADKGFVPVTKYEKPEKAEKAEKAPVLAASTVTYSVAEIPPYVPPAPEKNDEPEMVDCFRHLSKSSFQKKPAPEPMPIIAETVAEKPLKIIGELFKTYIVCEHGDELVLIDKHAAHERLNFEKQKRELIQHSQLLAEAVSVTLEPDSFSALTDYRDDMLELGIEIIPHGSFTVEVTAMPTMLDTADIPSLLETVAGIIKSGSGSPRDAVFGDILHSVSCKMSIRAHEYTSKTELEALAGEVWNDIAIRFCPHGRPIITTISKREIEKNFGRV